MLRDSILCLKGKSDMAKITSPTFTALNKLWGQTQDGKKSNTVERDLLTKAKAVFDQITQRVKIEKKEFNDEMARHKNMSRATAEKSQPALVTAEELKALQAAIGNHNVYSSNSIKQLIETVDHWITYPGERPC